MYILMGSLPYPSHPCFPQPVVAKVQGRAD